MKAKKHDILVDYYWQYYNDITTSDNAFAL